MFPRSSLCSQPQQLALARSESWLDVLATKSAWYYPHFHAQRQYVELQLGDHGRLKYLCSGWPNVSVARSSRQHVI